MKKLIVLMLVVLGLSGCLPQMYKTNDPEWVYQNTKIDGGEFSKDADIIGARGNSLVQSYSDGKVLLYYWNMIGTFPENGYYKYTLHLDLKINEHWIFFSSANLPGGKELKIRTYDRQVGSCSSGCLLTEKVVVFLEREHLCPGEDLRIMLYGKRGSQLVVIPDTYLQGFWKRASIIDKGYALSCGNAESRAVQTTQPVQPEATDCMMFESPDDVKACYAKQQ